MQDMSFRNQGYGYRGEWGHHRHHPAFFIVPMLLMGFLFFTVLKFLWPVLLVGLLFMFMRKGMMHGGMRHGHGGRGGWHGGMGPQWGGHGRHFGQGMRGHHGHPGHWSWDNDEEKPKRKNDDDQDDDKPKRDGNTLYV